MSTGDRTVPASIAAELLEQGGTVHPQQPGTETLAVQLVPVADGIRQLYTDFGLRTYRVFLVHVRWPAGRRGHGFPQETSRVEILPTPRVRDMNATTQVMHAIGLSEEGGLVIDQISPKYSEDDLRGRTPDMIDPADRRTNLADTDFFWEVAQNYKTQPVPEPRRYVPNSIPSLSRDGFQWTVSLTKQDYNRSRGQVLDTANARRQ